MSYFFLLIVLKQESGFTFFLFGREKHLKKGETCTHINIREVIRSKKAEQESGVNPSLFSRSSRKRSV
jgi:hypothetical protein